MLTEDQERRVMTDAIAVIRELRDAGVSLKDAHTAVKSAQRSQRCKMAQQRKGITRINDALNKWMRRQL